MSDRTTPSKMPTYTQTVDNYPPFGGIEIETVRGPVRVVDAPGLTSLAFDRDEASSIGLMIYEPSHERGGVGVGMIVQMGPATARNFAASLVHLANRIDGGRTN
jgi:hypothetical protein